MSWPAPPNIHKNKMDRTSFVCQVLLNGGEYTEHPRAIGWEEDTFNRFNGVNNNDIQGIIKFPQGFFSYSILNNDDCKQRDPYVEGYP